MGFFDKIKAGLTKTRDALSDSLSGPRVHLRYRWEIQL